ncbi:TonB family protein [Phenylobacterium sp.]|uniref:TonB family protein n=1 Tax=Phenylobacterium sp. TaxID=1871053 RepID=UPI0025ECD044|nr:TonB family protein [Phenylobacterium sp.]
MAMLASGTTVAAAEKSVITNPDWLELPSGEVFASLYPKVPLALEIAGYAQISCAIDEGGHLAHCTVLAEAPRALGFGAAALTMSREFRMRPQTVDGKAVAGGIVRIPIRFTLPSIGAEPKATGVDPDAQAYALRIVESQDVAQIVLKAFDAPARELESGPIAGTPDEARQAAVTALRSAAQHHVDDIRAAIATALALTNSRETLRQLADFQNSPGGEVLRENAAIGEDMKRLSTNLGETVLAEAHDALCSQRACRASPDELKAIGDLSELDAMDAPQWVKAPSAVAIGQAAPPLAAMLGVEGVARLTCTEQADGGIGACVVAAEGPMGWGYGAAALRLSTAYRLAPTADGAGRRVSLRVAFPAVEFAPRITVQPRIASESIELVRRLLDQASGRADVTRQIDRQLDAIAAAPHDGVDPQVADAVMVAMRAAFNLAFAQLLDRLADMLASRFSNAQLAEALAFRDSAAAHALDESMPALNAAAISAARRNASIIASEARGEFCKTHDCAQQPLAAASRQAQ